MRLGPAQQQLFQQLYIFGVCYSVNYVALSSILTKRIEMADPTKFRMKTSLKLGGFLGFTAGFLFAYQRSSCACILLLCQYFLLIYPFQSAVLGLDGK